MKSLNDPSKALANGLSKIRTEFHVPNGFPPNVVALAQTAAKRAPNQHTDRTAMPFVTLDPATSTDLDQAFSIEASGSDLLLHYAIADVAWFVEDGDAVDLEAWARGETLYLPDGKAGLYPPVLAEGAASLLPSGPRPAVIFTVRVAQDGAVKLDGAERAIIQSRAKLAYDRVRASDVPTGFAEIARRMAAAEERRGASRVDPPEQEVEQLADGTFQLAFRPLLQSEKDNAALSLAANMAIADAMLAHRTGLFRVMAPPDASKVQRLRNAAQALGLVVAGLDQLARLSANPRSGQKATGSADAGNPPCRFRCVLPTLCGRRCPVARGDGCDLCARHRAAEAAGGPLRRALHAGNRQRAAGAPGRCRCVRQIAEGYGARGCSRLADQPRGHRPCRGSHAEGT
ncbi:RNB domain-containing ribonuclease [Mesorhizobium neociceri]|uniref:RNB domain-containing ribonuclease n=1 Tax=Mesorhizobium neociceri TaxID=1307853 RepID=UPI001F158BC4|nr:RNB domain-containing ribonuclease [Mesorhizobium neociceri]